MSNTDRDTELLAAALRVVDENRRAGRHVTSAESCTGGMVAAAITEIAGASDVFESAYVTYSNEAKAQMLGVPRAVLEQYGAVSTETVEAMALGALDKAEADQAVAISGIAGPDGGTDDKPVGMVAFARAVQNKEAGNMDEAVSVRSYVRYFDPGLSRAEIRRLATLEALGLLLP